MKKGIKLAVSGKGGVGKTTLASLFCHILTRQNINVLAVDADPDANLGMALGFDQETLSKVVTIANERDLIREKTGAEPGSSGQWFSLNPSVEDIPERYVVTHRGIKLLQMGAVATGGGGCACPESTMLKALLSHLVLDEQDAVIVDMEAGLEHLGRGTARGVDAFIVVVEPGQRSLATAQQVVKLAADLGVKNVVAVANKVQEVSREELESALQGIPLVGVIPYTSEAVKADLQRKTLFDVSTVVVAEVERILDHILSITKIQE